MNTNSSQSAEKPAADTPVNQLSGKITPMDGPRFRCTNIRLSAALCALGFVLRDDAQPLDRVVEGEFKRRANCPQCVRREKHDHIDVTFYHSPTPIPDSPVLKTCPNLVAIDIEAWWRFPGKFSVQGFDDALTAMRRVLETREWILGVVHGSRQIVNAKFDRNSVVTDSIRFASVIKACGFDLIGFEKSAQTLSRFVFQSRAAGVVELITKTPAEQGDGRIYSDRRDDGEDLCVDWMLWALEYHARLLRKVKACVPMIELRDGERSMRLHSQMPKTLRREFIRHF